MPNVYSDEVCSLIINSYRDGVPVLEIAKMANTYESGVISYMHSIGYPYKRQNRWSKQDIEFLRENYENQSWDFLVSNLRRNKNSIIAKAYSIGVKREAAWTDEDIGILVDNYESIAVKDIASLLCGRHTYAAIYTKAGRLGLKSRELWAESELDIMREFYGTMSSKELVKLLPGRTPTTIVGMAKKLGLKSQICYTDEEISFIKDNWEAMPDKELAEALNRPFRGLKAKRGELGLFRNIESSGYGRLYEYIRHKNKEWRKKSIKNCGYKCVLSGSRFQDVHHLHGVNLIISESLNNIGLDIRGNVSSYSKDELDKILTEFLNVQNTYPLGVCLSHKIHMNFHTIYGFGDNTPDQYEEFKIKYYNVA